MAREEDESAAEEDGVTIALLLRCGAKVAANPVSSFWDVDQGQANDRNASRTGEWQSSLLWHAPLLFSADPAKRRVWRCGETAPSIGSNTEATVDVFVRGRPDHGGKRM